MKKAIIILLVAVVAMTAAFANTSDKDGFAIKADVLGYLGSYDVTYNMGSFRFGVEYLTATPMLVLFGTGSLELDDLYMLVYPLGGYASAGYKFIAAEHHELSAGVSIGYSRDIDWSFLVNVEYAFCFNQHHAVYLNINVPMWPFALDYAAAFSDIGYRYTF